MPQFHPNTLTAPLVVNSHIESKNARLCASPNYAGSVWRWLCILLRGPTAVLGPQVNGYHRRRTLLHPASAVILPAVLLTNCIAATYGAVTNSTTEVQRVTVNGESGSPAQATQSASQNVDGTAPQLPSSSDRAASAGSLQLSAQTPPIGSFVYIEDGEPSQKLKLPVYEWCPKDTQPDGMVLAIHGLTLHGKRYELLGKACACTGTYLVAADLRGFGRCRFDPERKFDKRKIDYDKSYEDLVALATWMRQKYPKIPFIVVGESLGATMALRLAAGCPQLVNAVVIAGPPSRINPLMFFYPDNMWQTFLAVAVRPRGDVKLTAFMRDLVSNDKKIGEEMLDDPLVAKKLTVLELLKSQSFVDKTVRYARGLAPNTPLLTLQGSQDFCVMPDAIVKISKNVRSSNQTMRWLDHHGHLLLETNYIRAATVDALVNWADDIDPSRKPELQAMEQLIHNLGGKSDD